MLGDVTVRDNTGGIIFSFRGLIDECEGRREGGVLPAREEGAEAQTG